MRANASLSPPLNSGELARLVGISPDTLRYYERRGLLPSVLRSASGYRLFPPETLGRVWLIRAALSIGFSVSELSDILLERNKGGAPCHRVRRLAAEKLIALETRLRDLQSCRREIRKALAEWDGILAKTPRGKQARLLEAFAATHPKSHSRSSNFRSVARGNQNGEKQR